MAEDEARAPASGGAASGADAVAVRRVGEERWHEYREVRLAMLLEAPSAFGGTHEQALARTEAGWRERLRTMPTWMAVGGDGAAVGAVSLYRFPEQAEGEICLIALWVAPGLRGTGLADRLVDTAVRHARRSGCATVTLDVAEHNQAARRLYERHGFRPTGRTGSLPHDRSVTELEMALELAPEPADDVDHGRVAP